MRRAVLAALLLPVLGGVVACSGEDGPAVPEASGSTAASAPSASATSPRSTASATATADAAAAYCSGLVPADQVADLLRRNPGAPGIQQVDGLPTCSWTAPDLTLQVASASSPEWAAALAAVGVPRGLAPAVRADVRTLEQQVADDVVDGDFACDVHNELLTASGAPDGADHLVRLVRSPDGPRVVGAACSEDHVTLVSFTGRSVRPAAVRPVTDLLQAVHGAPFSG